MRVTDVTLRPVNVDKVGRFADSGSRLRLD